MGSYHAKLSPSSADRWTTCTASVNAQEGIPNESSEASRDGTMCHQMSEEILRDGTDPHSYLGRTMIFWYRAEDEAHGEDWSDNPNWERIPLVLSIEQARIVVTEEHIEAVIVGTDFVKQLHALHGGEFMAEQQVPIGHFTGEPGARGTTDVLLLTPKILFVDDFKYGRVKVYAYEIVSPERIDYITLARMPEVVRPNLQMASYAIGAIEKYGMLYDWTHVTMTIIQPFVNHVSEYTCTIEELMKVRDFLAAKAEETRTNPQFVPTPDNCHFCRASGNCAAQTEMVADLALGGIDEQPKKKKVFSLGTLYALIPFVEDWCTAIAKRTRDTLNRDEPVIRDDGLTYKLVDGKMGGREWQDEAKAEQTMLGMRLGHGVIYEQKLITPAKLEKLATIKRPKKGQPAVPPIVGPTQWNRLQELIVQDRCQPAIALETDPRPAISKSDGFDEVGSDADLDSSLF